MGNTNRPCWRTFCEHYVVSGHGTQSAIKAGYAPKGAAVQATRLLKRDNVKAYLSELREAARQRSVVELEEVIRFWATALRLSPYDVLSFDASGKPVGLRDKMAPEYAAMIEGVSFSDGQTQSFSLNLPSKHTAAINLAKVLGAFEKHNTQRRPEFVLGSPQPPKKPMPGGLAANEQKEGEHEKVQEDDE